MDDQFFKMKWVSSLEKVFPGKEPNENLEGREIGFFANEMYSLQLAFCLRGEERIRIGVKAEGALAPYVSVREVVLMPSRYPARAHCDANYLDNQPGLYPDLLKPVGSSGIRAFPGQWQSLFLTVDLTECPKEKLPFGAQKLKLTFVTADEGEQGEEAGTAQITMTVLKESLPVQKLYHTEWFHGDCLADYYGVDVFGKKHKEIMAHFISHYAKMGMNTILVPTFTPPLDTAVGHERTTIQLVDVTVKQAGYEFNFKRLGEFFRLCVNCGILYFEIAHLFTQWGAKAAPKIMAVKEDGTFGKIFGWETDSRSEAYQSFLKDYLTALVAQLKEWGMRDNVFFHLSDEPDEDNRETYAYLREKIAGYLEDYPIMDALSRYSFYEQGVVDRPVPGIDHLGDFLEHGVKNLWTYYCCAQEKNVSNRFFAMPSARNRILGVLLYYHDIKGFLHWGFNFYNTQYSLEKLNPFAVTDADGAFPSGDSFLVYPGADGKPQDSLRMMVLSEAMQDIRAMELLESRSSREEVLKLIKEHAGMELTMFQYPATNDFILNLRREINRRIVQLSS